jgi:DNA-binding response OmpR family regulator
MRLKAINAELADRLEVAEYRLSEILEHVDFDDCLPLPRKPQAVLAALLRAPGKTVSKNALLAAADTYSVESLRVHITRIRNAVPSVEITSVFGIGYRATMRRAG